MAVTDTILHAHNAHIVKDDEVTRLVSCTIRSIEIQKLDFYFKTILSMSQNDLQKSHITS